MAKRLSNLLYDFERNDLSGLERRLLAGIWEKNSKRIDEVCLNNGPVKNSILILKNGINYAKHVLLNPEFTDTMPGNQDEFQ